MLHSTLKLTGLSFLASVLILTGCSSSPSSVAPAQPQALQPVAKAEPVIADMGKGIKTPAKLSFSINLRQVQGFHTQDSTPGVAAKTVTDLTHIKFYLMESNTGTAPTALGGTAFSYAISATNRTNSRVDVTFTNVPSNSSGKSYYVAVGGFNSATAIAANNITNLGAPISDSTEGKYFVSSAGGDLSNPGCVRVAPVSYALSGLDALAIPLQLLNAVSPILDSDVNITAGDEITGSPSGNGG